MIYDRLAAFYDQFVDQNLNNIYLDLIKKHRNKGNVIDLGCGTGPLAILLAKNKYNVTATDISDSMLERAYNNSIHENVHINFFVHNILEPLNINYDIITMASDVINYIEDRADVSKAFNYVTEVMNENSIFVFDFLKVNYLINLPGYHEEILLENSLLVWDVENTDKERQIKHIVTIDNCEETHIQTTFSEEEYVTILKECGLVVTEMKILNERIIFVCKKV